MIDTIFSLGREVRYVATYIDGELESKSRSDLTNSSQDNSDVFEELLVNPTLLTLATQRGNIDCGGLEFLLLRYGNFFQFVKQIPGDHVSVCFEPDADVNSLGQKVCQMISKTC